MATTDRYPCKLEDRCDAHIPRAVRNRFSRCIYGLNYAHDMHCADFFFWPNKPKPRRFEWQRLEATTLKGAESTS